MRPRHGAAGIQGRERAPTAALTSLRLTTPAPHYRTLPSYIVYLVTQQILRSQEKTKISHSPRFRAVKRLQLCFFNPVTTFTFRSGTDSKHTGWSFTRIVFAMFRQQNSAIATFAARWRDGAAGAARRASRRRRRRAACARARWGRPVATGPRSHRSASALPHCCL